MHGRYVGKLSRQALKVRIAGDVEKADETLKMRDVWTKELELLMVYCTSEVDLVKEAVTQEVEAALPSDEQPVVEDTHSAHLHIFASHLKLCAE